jgi:uncharacterized membrane protein YcaP (DUF421 family)
MGWWHQLIGSGPQTITWWQMCIRAVFIFLAGLLLIRAGGRRTFGKTTSFDIVVAVVLGSILSRAVTANAELIPTIAAGGILVLLHYVLGKIALYSRGFGFLVKGNETELVRNGEMLWKNLRRNNLTPHDLREAARLNGVLDFKDVEQAYLERNGAISIFKRGAKREP